MSSSTTNVSKNSSDASSNVANLICRNIVSKVTLKRQISTKEITRRVLHDVYIETAKKSSYKIYHIIQNKNF